MIRSDVLKTLIPLISDELVVTNIGLPSQETVSYTHLRAHETR